MNRKEHLLICLIEEAAEIQQAATKALRFGLSDCRPGTGLTNAHNISYELVDLMAVVDMCVDGGIIEIPKEEESMRDIKCNQVERYLKYSKLMGHTVGERNDGIK